MRQTFISEIPKEVVICGNGPYKEEDFYSLMEEKDIEPFHPTDEIDGIDTIILGDSFDEEELNNLIDELAEARVYSQEMFLAFVATNQDPYNNFELLEAFSKNHSGLRFLIDNGFEWPQTTILVGSGEFEGIDIGSLPTKGLLKYLGYSVGKKGLPVKERHKILKRVFYGALPSVNVENNYIKAWGKARSSDRLEKMANCLAAFARNAKRKKSADMSKAIKEWEDDLAWLKENFYHGSFRFHWPVT